jgi:hypothetical protein
MLANLIRSRSRRSSEPWIDRWRRRTATAVGVRLTVGLATSATAATYRPPAGAVKLPARSVKHVSGVTCGQVRGTWRPGTSLPASWFVTDAQQSANFTKAARQAEGAAKRADLAQAKA